MVKEDTIQHSTYAVVVRYEADRESVPRVAGPKTTTPDSTCAVEVLYEANQESVPRVVGPKTTTPDSTCAVEVLYEGNRESLLRVVGPKHTTPDSSVVVVGKSVEMLLSCRNHHLMKISYQIKLYLWTSNLSVRLSVHFKIQAKVNK